MYPQNKLRGIYDLASEIFDACSKTCNVKIAQKRSCTYVTQHQVLTQHHCTKNRRLELSTVTSSLGNLQPCSKKLRHF